MNNGRHVMRNNVSNISTFEFKSDEVGYIRTIRNLDGEFEYEVMNNNPDVVEELFDEAIMEANYALQFNSNDRVGISVLGRTENGIRNVVYVSYQPYSSLSAKSILTAISKKLKSTETLKLNFNIMFSRIPAIPNLNMGNSNTIYRGENISFATTKKSILSLCPPNDNITTKDSCFLQFIVIGLASAGIGNYPLKHFKGSHRFLHRKKAVEEFNFPEYCNQEDLLMKIEEMYDVQFVLIEASSLMLPVYPFNRPCNNSFKRVVGLVQKSGSDIIHVDYVEKPWLLLGSKFNRWCGYCFRFYHKKVYCGEVDCKNSISCKTCHDCDGTCKSCGTIDCHLDEDPTIDFGNCDLCRKPFKSVLCSVAHKCKVTKKCPKCNLLLHPRRTCNQVFCKKCFQKYFSGERHLCSLTTKKLKKPSEKIVVYDFECIARDIHIPYLVCARIIDDHPSIENLKSKYTWRIVDGKTVFIFWGLHKAAEDFVDFICSSYFDKYTFVAHNAKSYDLIFIKSVLTKRKIFTEDIRSGMKLLWMFIPHLKISFIDSLNFMASSLRSLAKDFNVPMQKSYFPYELVDEKYFECAKENDWVLPSPTLNLFDVDPDDNEAVEWITSHYTENWNLKEESILYCSLDVIVLEQVILLFRTDVEKMCPGLDVFQYITLQSAIMNYFLASVLEQGVIMPIDTYSIECEIKTVLWEKSIDGEKIDNKNVRSMVVKNNETFILLDCFNNGCTLHHIPTTKSKRNNGKTFEQVRLESERFIDTIPGKINKTWTCDIKDSPFVIRDAYKGGKSEVYYHEYYGKISMADFVSEYPSVMMGHTKNFINGEPLEWKLPIGKPSLEIAPKCIDLTKEGIAQVTIYCPDIFAPLLSYKVNSYLNPSSYETIYGCCKTCMESRNVEPCSHTIDERKFTGTWCISELREAVSIGYIILQVEYALTYEESSSSLFKDFLSPFMIAKMTSKKKGLVDNNQLTEFGKNTCKYVEEVYNVKLTTESFSDSPSKRQAAKLIMNAFTGKWGQKEVHTKTSVFYPSQEKECLELLYRSNVEIVYVQVLDEDGTVIIQSKDKLGETNGHISKNDIIISYITAGGRIMLNRAERACGTRLLYVDTDSAYFIKSGPTPFLIGYNPGDLELELEEGDDFAAIARKTYSYNVEGVSKIKQKGVQVTWKNKSLFNLPSIQDLIDSVKRMLPSITSSNKKVREEAYGECQIQTNQMLFKTIDLDGLAQKKTVVMKKNIRFHVSSAKRVIRWQDKGSNIITYPYGWKTFY